MRLDLQDMVNQADLIIVSQVMDAESVWIDRNLYTRYTIAVDETVKGEEHNTVQVMVIGGIDLNRPVPIGLSVPGSPMFFIDERVVLILKRTTSFPGLTNTYSIVGFNQGISKINIGPAQAQDHHLPLTTEASLDRFVDKLYRLVSNPNPPTSPQGIYFQYFQQLQ